MFHINLEFKDIKILSIEKEDLSNIYSLINSQENLIEHKQFYDRFLEYYLNECEFFLKISENNNLVGIFKGKVEFKNPNEVWINHFLLDSKVRNHGLGSEILKNIMNYFTKDCGIINFYTKVEEINFKALSFWQRNSFVPIKVKNNEEKSIILGYQRDKMQFFL